MRRVVLTGLLSLLALVAAPGTADENPLPDWQALHFKASKFFLTAHMEVRLEKTPAPLTDSDLLSSPEGRTVALPAHAPWTIELASSIAGRSSRTLVWFDPQTHSALQRLREKLGSRPYDKLSRFTLDGVYTRRRSPTTDAEADGPATTWSKVETKFEAYRDSSPKATDDNPSAPCGAVLEATQLLYLLPTLDFENPPGNLCVFSDGKLSRVLFEARGKTSIKIDLEETAADGSQRRREADVIARCVVVRSQALDNRSQGQLELLGLEGDLEIFVDEAQGLPLEIRGKLPRIGSVQVKLVGVELGR